MMQQNWWEQYERADQPPPASSATAPKAPGIIYGRPKQPDQLELRRLQLSEEANARAEAAADRAARSEERAIAASEKANVKPTEDQSKAAAASVRLRNSLADITAAMKRSPSEAKPGIGESIAGLFGEDARGFAQSEDRQRIHAAQLDMLDAALFLATGAAYNKEQLQNTWRSHFPQLTDSPGTIEDKRKRLRAVLESAKVRAGPASQQIDDAIKNLDTIFGQPKSDITPEAVGLTPENLVNYLSGDSGGSYSIERDGLYYTPPGGKPEYVHIPDEVANSDQYAEVYRQKFGEEPMLQVSITDDSPSELDAKRESQVLDPIVRGIADTVTLGLADELEAGRKTLFEGGTMRENLANQRAIDRSDERTNPYLRMGGQLAGGVLPWGRMVGRGSATGGPRSAWRLAGEGAGLGGAYAFGSAEGDLGDRLSAVPGGAAIGGVAAGGLGALANRMGRGGGTGGPTPPTRRDVASAARDTGIDVLLADVGGPVTKGLTGASRQMFLSELPIAAKVTRATEQGAEFRGQTAASVGRALDKADAGELVRKAADVHSRETGRIGGALYKRAEELSAGTRVFPNKAMDSLDRQIAELEESPLASSLLEEFRQLREKLATGDFSIPGIRDMRKRLREEMTSRGLRGSDTDRRLKSVVDAASEDIADSLAASGNQRAAQAFRTADEYWRKRVETIDQVLDPLLGKNAPRSGEQILGTLERMASRETGDVKRLQRVVAAMPAEEASSVRATIINRLGQPANAEEGAFSFSEFAKRWDTMSPKAKEILFPRDARLSLDKLATVARGAKATSAYSNTSNTARALGGQALFSGIVGGTAGLPALAASAGGQYALGKLLTAKLFVNLLARAPDSTPETFMRGLSNVAKRDPALAQDALGLQRALEQAFAQTPLRAAATTDEKKK